MASAGLKRPSDFDLEYPSPHTSPSSTSAANPCQWSANKRRCITFANQSMMATSAQLANANQTYAANLHQQSHQQTHHQSYQHNHCPSHLTSPSAASSLAPPPTLASSPFKDPSLVLGSLCDDVSSIIKNEVHRAHHQQQQGQLQTQAQQHNHQVHQPNQSHQSLPLNHDAPTLSIRQTQAICEKIIREREQKLREEYDKILISKLAEQYDTFVKYTHDHIERHYNETNSHQASYLS